MINDLIKKCQEGYCESCKECEYNLYNLDNLNNEIFCLNELVNVFNKKYKTNYTIINYDNLIKARELLYEC